MNFIWICKVAAIMELNLNENGNARHTRANLHAETGQWASGPRGLPRERGPGPNRGRGLAHGDRRLRASIAGDSGRVRTGDYSRLVRGDLVSTLVVAPLQMGHRSIAGERTRGGATPANVDNLLWWTK
jgi:hypothetical protein